MTDAACSFCAAGAEEACKTTTNLLCTRVHISRPGEVGEIESAGPNLDEVLNRHPTDISRYLAEFGR